MSETLESESYASLSYLLQYQLTREPFAVDDDTNQDDFFLLDSERAQRLNMLYHMSQNSELLLVVSGVYGSGKSSLLNKFIDMRTDSWRQCVVNATPTTNPDQLLIEIAEGFGLPQDSVTFSNALDMLQNRLIELKRSELMPILIIDDAHQLPTASLTILLKLSELADSDVRLLRIVLFGEPAINDMFNAPELKELKHRITHTLTMPPLTEKQTSDYIHYRLSVAGLVGDSPLSPSQIKRIHRLSNGIPGMINQFAQEILMGTNTATRTAPSFSSRLRSATSIILMLGFAAGITWYLNRDTIESFGQSQTDEMAELEVRDLPLLPPNKKLSDTNTTSVTSLSKPADKFDAISGGVHTKPNVPTIKTPEAPVAINDTQSKSSEALPVSEKPDPVATPVVETNEKSTLSPNAEVDTTNIEQTTADIPSSPATITEAKVIATPSTKPEPSTEPTPSIPSSPKVAKPLAEQNWLSQQNPDHFTLQLMGSRKLSSLNLVQRAHKLTSQSAIIRTELKGDAWYILVYKSFPSKQQARDGAKALPKALKLTQPWPRRLGELQNIK